MVRPQRFPTRLRTQSSLFAAPLLGLMLAGGVGAQGFPQLGKSTNFGFTGKAVDVAIPTTNVPDWIEVQIKGGDGGTARSKNGRCVGVGGKSPLVQALVPIGRLVRAGGTLRVIVGAKGASATGSPASGGGGGGGSALLYAPPGTTNWSVLLASGGGGGGHVDSLCQTSQGRPGSKICNLSSCATNGGGATNGGSGGGGFRTGGGSHSPSTGGAAGGFTGGAGGSAGDAAGRGGWGFGGGGGGHRRGGAGGGGYAGGPGNPKNYEGFGGLSFADPELTQVSGFRFVTYGSNGGVAIASVRARAGETCHNPVTLTDRKIPDYELPFTSTTRGRINTIGLQPVSQCLLQGNTPDEWYRFVNELACPRRITVSGGQEQFLLMSGAGKNCVPITTCDVLGGSVSAAFTVPGRSAIMFRVSSLERNGPTVNYSIKFRITGSDFDDPDGDGLPNCVDNCPLTYNPGQQDFDKDGVGDICDSCVGDNRIDRDNDGIPDACDPCIGPATDCDGNGIGDKCDLTEPARLVTFSDPAHHARTLKLNSSAFSPAVLDQRLRMTNAPGKTLAGAATAMFEPVSPNQTRSFGVQFWARHTAANPGNSLGGFSFTLLDASRFAADRVVRGESPTAGMLSIAFTNSRNGQRANQIVVIYGGRSLFRYTVPFVIDDGVWRKFSIGVSSGRLSVTTNTYGQAPTTLVSGFQLPNFQPFQARYALNAHSAANAAASRTSFDQVYFRDLSGLFNRDLDGNDVLDSCEHVSQVKRLGIPANPDVLRFGHSVGFVMGSTYEPWIDHTQFMPNATTDLLVMSFTKTNTPSPFGVLLGSVDIIFTSPAGSRFKLPFPNIAQGLGFPVTFQGAALDPAQQVARVTNAIDGTVTGWQPGR